MTAAAKIALSLSLLVPGLAGAHGKHEHGVAHVDAALDAAGMELAITADGEGIVGFEHAPETPADQALSRAAGETLAAGSALVRASPEANCRLTRKQVEPPEAADGEHSDWRANYRFTCSSAAAITQLDFTGLFNAFPGLRAVELQLVTPRTQTGAELSPENPRAVVPQE